MVFGLRALEQMKLNKTRNAVKVRVAVLPNILEGLLGPPSHTKTIHGDKHFCLLLLQELACRQPSLPSRGCLVLVSVADRRRSLAPHASRLRSRYVSMNQPFRALARSARRSISRARS